MKLYLFCYDHDGTMRSIPQPEKAFKTKAKALQWGKDKGYVKDTDNTKEWWTLMWKIKEIELVE